MKHAAARALAAAAAGVAAARVWPGAFWPVLALAVLAAALSRLTRGWSLLVLLSCAAFMYSRVRTPEPPGPETYRARSFRGIVASEPVGGAPEYVTVELSGPLRGKVMLWQRRGDAELRYGDAVIVHAPVKRLDFPRNPGLADHGRVMASRGFVGSASPKPGQVSVTDRGRGFWLVRRVVMPMRRYVFRVIERFLPGPEGGLLAGLLVGGRQRLPRAVQQAFADAGIVHIMAVSGMNVAVVIGAVWLLLAVLGVRGWWRFGASLLAAVAYLGLAGWSAAPARAGFMACMALLSVPTQRRVTASASLSVAGLVLLLIDPEMLFDTGAQLSFAATLAIVLTAGRAWDWLKQKGVHPLLRRYLLGPAAVSLAAAVGTGPLLLQHFCRVQLLGFVATLLVAPLVSLAMPLGLGVVVLNLVSGTVAGVLAESLRLVLGALIWVTRLTATMTWQTFEPGRLGWPWVFWLYALGLLAAGWRRPWARTALRVGLAGGLAVLVWTGVLRPKEARFTFLDPGSGDAIVMEDTLGNILLLDAGVDRRGVLRDYLRSRGIHRVDVVIVTHPDRDHFGGLLDLEERVRLGTLLVPTRTRGDSGYERLLARLEAQGTRVVVAGSGTDVTGLGFGLRVLWPDPVTRGLYEAGLMSTNPVSLVALLEYRGFRMLLPGDLDEPEAIAELGVTAELLKSPHHGSRKGNPQRLFDAVRPQQLVVMGRYPTPARLEERLARPPPVYVNTRRDGGCVLRFRGARPVWQRSLAPR